MTAPFGEEETWFIIVLSVTSFLRVTGKDEAVLRRRITRRRPRPDPDPFSIIRTIPSAPESNRIC
jgi:hypothetical protein